MRWLWLGFVLASAAVLVGACSGGDDESSDSVKEIRAAAKSLFHARVRGDFDAGRPYIASLCMNDASFAFLLAPGLYADLVDDPDDLSLTVSSVAIGVDGDSAMVQSLILLRGEGADLGSGDPELWVREDGR